MSTTVPAVPLYRLTDEHLVFGLPFAEAHGGAGTGELMLCVVIARTLR
jgi:hypothetical protein